MKRSILWLFIVLLIVALGVSACGKKDAPETVAEAPTASAQAEEADGEPAKAPADAQEPAEAAEPTVAPEPAEADEDALNVEDRQSGLDKFDSYKAQWFMSWESVEDGKTESGGWKWVEERVKDPRASRLVWTTSSNGEDAGSMESTEIGGMRYTIMAGADGERACIAGESDEASDSDSMFNPGSLGSVSGARFVGRENLNGMPTRHYRYDEKAAALGGFSKLQGEIWVAADSDTVLKETASWEGGGLFGLATGAEGKGTWTWEVTEVNQPIDIQAPAECQSEASQLPVLPDAQEKIQAGDAVMYESATALDAVVEFYRKELKAAGWTEQEGGMTTEDMAMLTFTKEAMTAQLMASRNDDMTGVSISIAK